MEKQSYPKSSATTIHKKDKAKKAENRNWWSSFNPPMGSTFTEIWKADFEDV